MNTEIPFPSPPRLERQKGIIIKNEYSLPDQSPREVFHFATESSPSPPPYDRGIEYRTLRSFEDYGITFSDRDFEEEEKS